MPNEWERNKWMWWIWILKGTQDSNYYSVDNKCLSMRKLYPYGYFVIKMEMSLWLWALVCSINARAPQLNLCSCLTEVKIHFRLLTDTVIQMSVIYESKDRWITNSEYSLLLKCTVKWRDHGASSPQFLSIWNSTLNLPTLLSSLTTLYFILPWHLQCIQPWCFRSRIVAYVHASSVKFICEWRMCCPITFTRLLH